MTNLPEYSPDQLHNLTATAVASVIKIGFMTAEALLRRSHARADMNTVGNPLIAITMIEHDVEAGLDVPVRLAIYRARRIPAEVSLVPCEETDTQVFATLGACAATLAVTVHDIHNPSGGGQTRWHALYGCPDDGRGRHAGFGPD